MNKQTNPQPITHFIDVERCANAILMMLQPAKKKIARVTGSYKCGCTYGPIKESERFEYCPTHGDDILSEYAAT